MDLQGLTSNQDYLSLPQTERAKVVEHIAGKNPDFQSLPEIEKIKVLNHLVQYKAPPKAPVKETPKAKDLTMGQEVKGDLATAGDFITGAVTGIGKTAYEAGLTLYQHAIKGNFKTGFTEAKTQADKTFHPVEGYFTGLNEKSSGEGTTAQSRLGRVMGAVGVAFDNAANKAAQVTGNPDMKAGTSMLMDNVMQIMGLGATTAIKGMKTFKDVKEHIDSPEGAKSLKEKLNQLTPNAPKEQIDVAVKEVQKSLSEVDERINAETKAHDLMQRGASKKEVEAVIRKNPLVGTIMEEIRQRRADQKAAMQHTLQGEHLGPEGDKGPSQLGSPKETPPSGSPETKSPANNFPALDNVEHIEAAPAPKEFPEESPLTNNASGESAASIEAQHRFAQEKYTGALRSKLNTQTGEVTPLVTADAVDYLPKGHDVVVQKDPTTGKYTVVSQGDQVHPGALQGAIARATPKLEQHPFAKQAGKADPELLAAVGLTAGGAMTGYLLSDKDRQAGALLGGILGFGAGRGLTKVAKVGMKDTVAAMRTNWKDTVGNIALGAGAIGAGAHIDQENRIEGALFGAAFAASRNLPKAKHLSEEELVVAYHDGIQAHNRIVGNVINAVKEYIPDEGARKAFYEKMHRKDFANMTDGEREVAATWKQLQVQYGEMAKEAGVIKGFIEDYVPRIASKTGMQPSEVQKLLSEIVPEKRNFSGSTRTKHGKSRTQDTFDDFLQAAKAKGLDVDNVDFADVMGDYLRSMNKAVQSAKLIKTLEEAKDPQGAPNGFIVPAEKAPTDYKVVNNPQMIGKRVHPELADAMNIVMGGHNHHEIVNGALAITSAAKRINVLSSFFHAKSLGEAAMLAGKNPFDRTGISKALDMFKNGVTGDEIDKGIKSGLMVGHPDDAPVGAIGKLGELMDVLANKALGTNIKTAGKALTAVEKAQMAVFDRATWDYLHTGLKLSTYLKEMEAYRSGKKYQGMKEEDVRKGIASGINDTYGGLNWARVHQEAQTVVGRKITSLMASPNGRDMMGLLMFAPDWTTSTLRAFSKGLPGGTANKANAAFARRYVRNTIIAYLVGLNAINIATSGHPIWDNKDPTKIQLPDGEVMQLMKHSMEPYEATMHPTKFITNKLGAPVKVASVGLTNSTNFNPNYPVQSRVGAVAGLVSPFSANAFFDPNVSKQEALMRSAAGILGVGIYGTSNAMKQTEDYKRRQRERYARMHGNKPKDYNPTR